MGLRLRLSIHLSGYRLAENSELSEISELSELSESSLTMALTMNG